MKKKTQSLFKPQSFLLVFIAVIPIIIGIVMVSNHQKTLGLALSDSAGVEGITIDVVENGFHGGGFVSNVSVSSDGQVVYGGGDVSGVHRSDNGGAVFHTKNKGLRSLKIASITATPDNPSIVYAGTGDKGNSGGLYYSTDSGDSWQLTLASEQAQSGTKDFYKAAFFAGNHPADADPVPEAHPRPNGNLIAVDFGDDANTRTDDLIIAGTYKHGVQFFSAGGDIHENTVLGNGFIRGVSTNPSVPTTAYAAAYFEDDTKNGIYKIDYANLSNPEVSFVYETPEPEEVVLLKNGHVYAAIGTDGIVKFDGSAWATQNSGLRFDDTHTWQGVNGYVSPDGRDIVYIGVNNSMRSGGEHYSNIWRSTDGGDRWTALVNQSQNVIMDVYDGDTSDGGGAYWWFRDGFGEATLGRRNTVVSSINVVGGGNNNVNDDKIFLSGRGGIWKSADGGGQWYPAVNNFQTSTNRDIAVNPNNPKQVIIGNTDYTLIEGSNRLISGDVERDRPNDPHLGGSAGHRGYDVVFDAVADQAILAAGDRDNNIQGEVFTKAASDVGNLSVQWDTLSLGPITGGNRVRSVVYGYHDGADSTSQTILAAVEGQGVYRYHEGSWNESLTNVPITNTQRSNFIWPNPEDSGVVYLVDLSAGFYRSMDGGKNWENMWPSMTLNNADYWTTGYIAASDDDPSTLYVSIQGKSGSPIGTSFKIFRLENANNPSTIYGNPSNDPNISDISSHSGSTAIKRPSALKVDATGRLWLTQQQSAPQGDEAGLFIMENPKSDSTFTDLTTQEYKESVTEPIGIDIAVDGYLYVAQRGLGIMKVAIQEDTQTQPNQPPSSAALDTTAINENNQLNATVGSLTVVDPDDETTFTVQNSNCATPGADDDFFKAGNFGGLKIRTNDISRIDGQVLPPLDYENPVDANKDNRYQICIVIKDADGARLEQRLTIEVLDVAEGSSDIIINARGTNAKEKIALFINNQPVEFWTLTNNFKDYTHTPDGEVTINELSVHFLNDTWAPEQNINYDAQIPSVTVNGITYSSEHESTVSTGSWDQDNWCAPGNKKTQWLHCNGSFTYNVPAGTVIGASNRDQMLSPVCGNNIKEQGEQCDDGNTTNGDGCSSSCQKENAAVATPGSTLTDFQCSYASARVLGLLFGDGDQLTGGKWQLKGKARLQREVTDHLEEILQASNIRYIGEFNDNTDTTDGQVDSPTDGRTIRAIALNGLTEDALGKNSIVDNPSTNCDLEAFLAGVFETEGSASGQVFDGSIAKRTLLREVFEELGFTTMNFKGTNAGGTLNVGESEWSKFQSYPFSFCSRVPGSTKYCRTNQKGDPVLKPVN